VKVAVINKCTMNNNEIGLMWVSGGIAPNPRGMEGLGTENPALGNFFNFSIKIM